MRPIHVARPLFDWQSLRPKPPAIVTIEQFLDTVPDEPLLQSLREARGKGRDDYPVEVLWRIVLLTSVLRHYSTDAMLHELQRNESLWPIVGVDCLEKIPRAWNVSRFLETLGKEPHRPLLHEVFNQMIARLGEVVSDLGAHTAGDATGLSARKSRKKKATPSDLPQASGGRKEYVDDDGKVSRVVEWFGFKLHLLTDVQHEIALAYKITDTKAGDGETLPDLLSDAEQNLGEGRIQTLAYDKAADGNDVHRLLSDKQIKAIIENRSLWKDDFERMLPGHTGDSNIVYGEAGTVYCYDRRSEPMIRHKMSYVGYEPARETIKYRCPAKHEGWSCPMSEICNAGKTYGLTIRVSREIDVRRFPSLPRGTKKFERLYRGRTSVERVNARLKVFWGVDDGNVSGSERFFAQVGAVMVVHAGFATLLAAAPRWEGKLSQTKLGTIARALHDKYGWSGKPTKRKKKRKPPKQYRLAFG